MKCPHCGQEHSDNTNFCPETGKKIEVSQDRAGELIACTNPSCSDFGKRILPSDSKFCPTCGASLKKCSDVVSILLSLHDDTLGETNIYDIDAEEYVKSDSPMLRNEKAISINNYTKYGGSVSFVARSSDKKV